MLRRPIAFCISNFINNRVDSSPIAPQHGYSGHMATRSSLDAAPFEPSQLIHVGLNSVAYSPFEMFGAFISPHNCLIKPRPRADLRLWGQDIFRGVKRIFSGGGGGDSAAPFRGGPFGGGPSLPCSKSGRIMCPVHIIYYYGVGVGVGLWRGGVGGGGGVLGGGGGREGSEAPFGGGPFCCG